MAVALALPQADGMDIAPFGPDDADAVAAYVDLRNAVQAVDAPWVHPMTVHQAEGAFRHGWDGEPENPLPRGRAR